MDDTKDDGDCTNDECEHQGDGKCDYGNHATCVNRMRVVHRLDESVVEGDFPTGEEDSEDINEDSAE